MKTKRLTPGDVAQGAEIIASGGLLGIPTETVYGLGANGLAPEAVKAIFEAKGRPQDNPLILHIPSEDWLERYCGDIPPVAYELAARFWPGPLTMILYRKPGLVPDIVTAGGETVGVRCPDHEMTLQLLQMAGVPLATPSANLSGMPSAKDLKSVLAYFDGKIPCAVDGGACLVGVESTIVDLTVTPYKILRQGGLSERCIAEALTGE